MPKFRVEYHAFWPDRWIIDEFEAASLSLDKTGATVLADDKGALVAIIRNASSVYRVDTLTKRIEEAVKFDEQGNALRRTPLFDDPVLPA